MAVWFRSALAALLIIFPPVIGRGLSDESKSRIIDPAKLPPNAVIIFSDNPADALNNVDAVVLTPDEYRKLLTAAEQARRLAAPDKAEPPSVCRFSGAIERRGAIEVAVL